MWTKTWRDETWNALPQREWDVLIIGGGITGAGAANMAARQGLRVLLLEANDFASGTSSRSSKLVHGGMRYLRNGQFSVTRESVRERESMLREAPQLVNPLKFLLPEYRRYRARRGTLALGVLIYDLLAPKWAHRRLSPSEIAWRYPALLAEGLLDGCEYYDAAVDDSRLVLRQLREACARGAAALNYAAVTGLLRSSAGQVCGVVVEDRAGQRGSCEVQAGVVINAAGPWSDDIRTMLGSPERLRPLRGSHLVFPRARLPLQHAVSLMHPRDGRFMFAIPWEGTTLLGTTDLDHHQPPGESEPRISSAEVEYLLEAAGHFFPALALSEADLLSTFAGVRPVIQSAAGSPSKASRRHVVWEENGLVTVTGGKLTIFRIMAAEALQAAARVLARRGRSPALPPFHHRLPAFDPLPEPPDLLDLPFGPGEWLALAGRYAAETPALLAAAAPTELEPIPGTLNLWAELRHAARCEGVAHLDDLLLRRVRLGLLAPGGGLPLLPQVRQIVQPELGWDDARWQQEAQRYAGIWQTYYSLPGLQTAWPQSRYNRVSSLP